MKKEFFKNIDWMILIYPLILLAIGLLGLYSASKNSNFEAFWKQINWFIVSIPVLIFFVVVDYRKLAKFSPIFYIVSILLLVAVIFTPARNGASSWFSFGPISFQPGEVGKNFIVIAISALICHFQLKGKDNINKPGALIVTLIAMLIPVALIIKEPDYGTALAYVIAFAAILFVAGIRKRYIFFMMILSVIAVTLIWKYILPVYAPHAISRIQVFLDPSLDPRGSGYNVIQSKLAIGSGHIFGMGLFNGPQTQLGYLYPKTTDFIFSLISEEFGFVLSATIIIVYLLLILKGIKITATASDTLGSYIAIGVTAILFYHVVENIGMTMGMLPVTGIPLPFVSYGGSNLVSNFIAIGLLLNISARRKKALYVELDK